MLQSAAVSLVSIMPSGQSRPEQRLLSDSIHIIVWKKYTQNATQSNLFAVLVVKGPGELED